MIFVESVYIHPTTIRMHKGEWYYDATAYVLPNNATCKSVKWSSGNPDIVAVNETTGYLYGTGVGRATIYATACDGSGKYGIGEVEVGQSILVSTLKLEASKITIKKGKTYTFSPTILPENAADKKLLWYSSNTTVATISENGVLSAKSLGLTQITAVTTDGSVRIASCDVKVTERQLVNSVALSAERVSVYTGKTKQLTATVFPSDAENKTITWSSRNPNIATVDAATGKVTGVSAGTATIFASATDGSGIRGYCYVDVDTYVPATKITVDPTRVTLALNEKADITAKIYPSDTTAKNVNWTVSNRSIVSLDDYGNTVRVTAKAAGTAEVIASCDGVSVKCIVTVDTRERVYIEQEGQYYNARFESGAVWKIIGTDMSVYNPLAPDELWDRSNYNQTVLFTKKQIAYLYLLDPLGVQYYVKNYRDTDENLTDINYLFFIDDVYYEIFHEKPDLFLPMPSGNLQPYDKHNPTASLRNSVYSYAEVIFGEHVVVPPHRLTIVDSIVDVTLSIFSFIPVVAGIQTGLELCRALFFAGTVADSVSGAASTTLQEYLNYNSTSNAGNNIAYRQKIEKFFKWAGYTCGLLNSVGGVLANLFTPPNLNDLSIYKKVQEQDYRTIFSVTNSEISIQEITEYYSLMK